MAQFTHRGAWAKSLSQFLSVCTLLVMSSACLSAEEMRTWTDASGKHKMEGTYAGTAGTKVKLLLKTGKKMEIELKQLSPADQKYVESLDSENPFKPEGDDPFQPAGDEAGEEEMADGKERTVTVDWNDSEGILLEAPSEEWAATVAAYPDLGFKPKSVALPAKKDFFEGMKGIAFNPIAKKTIVGYGNREDGVRLVMCDLKTGKTAGIATSPGKMAPIALHDDGKQIVMRRDDFGFGKIDRLEVWTIKGKGIQKSLTWTPYDDVQGGDRDVMWAEFADANHLVTSSRGGKVVVWEYPSVKPICHFELVGGAVPCLSGDRKTIGFCNGERMGLFDIAERQVIAMAPVTGKLQWPYTAFSPSGKRMACIAFSRILVWDMTTGKLIQDFETPGIHIHGAISFPDDNFILGANKFLIDLDNQIKLWEYSGAEQFQTAGNLCFAGVGAHNAPGALLTVQLPHPAAKDLLAKALTQPDLFVFRSGTAVKLDVSGVPAADQGHVSEALTKKLADMKCSVADNGTITLLAAVTGPKEREISYHGSGDYKVQEYLTDLRFVYQGVPAWTSGGTNVPGMLWLKQGENIEGVLRKAGEKPNMSFYDGVILPKFLQKPSAGNGATGRQTLGASQFTASGLK